MTIRTPENIKEWCCKAGQVKSRAKTRAARMNKVNKGKYRWDWITVDGLLFMLCRTDEGHVEIVLSNVQNVDIDYRNKDLRNERKRCQMVVIHRLRNKKLKEMGK